MNAPREKEIGGASWHPAHPERLHTEAAIFVANYVDPDGHRPTTPESVLLLDCLTAFIEKLREAGAIPAAPDPLGDGARLGAERLQDARRLAEYWISHGRGAKLQRDAVLCVENGANVWKNAAYALAERLAHADAAMVQSEAERDQEHDIRRDRETVLEIIAEQIGVPGEPHQTFFDRLIEAAKPKARLPDGWSASIRDVGTGIVVSHPQVGGCVVFDDPNNIARVVLYRLLEALIGNPFAEPAA